MGLEEDAEPPLLADPPDGAAAPAPAPAAAAAPCAGCRAISSIAAMSHHDWMLQAATSRRTASVLLSYWYVLLLLSVSHADEDVCGLDAAWNLEGGGV